MVNALPELIIIPLLQTDLVTAVVTRNTSKDKKPATFAPRVSRIKGETPLKKAQEGKCTCSSDFPNCSTMLAGGKNRVCFVQPLPEN